MKWLKRGIVTLIVITIVTISILGVMGYREYDRVISEKSIEQYVEELENSETYVALKDVDVTLQNATVAIEDRRFYKHNGIDIIGICRAIYNNILAKDITGGGSTITQQLAKNMYFSGDYTMERKVAEAFIAWKLENMYTKDKILELYINIINYGDNNIGIYKASVGYFNVEPSQLSLAQASLLAGLPQSPSNFQLSNHYDAAKIRQQQVLNAMIKEAMITDEESRNAFNDI